MWIPLDVERRLEQRWATRFLSAPRLISTAPDIRKGKEPAISPPEKIGRQLSAASFIGTWRRRERPRDATLANAVLTSLNDR